MAGPEYSGRLTGYNAPPMRFGPWAKLRLLAGMKNRCLEVRQGLQRHPLKSLARPRDTAKSPRTRMVSVGRGLQDMHSNEGGAQKLLIKRFIKGPENTRKAGGVVLNQVHDK